MNAEKFVDPIPEFPSPVLRQEFGQALWQMVIRQYLFDQVPIENRPWRSFGRQVRLEPFSEALSDDLRAATGLP